MGSRCSEPEQGSGGAAPKPEGRRRGLRAQVSGLRPRVQRDGKKLILCVLPVLGVLLCGLCVVAFAQTAERQRAEALAKRAGDRVRDLQAEALQLANQERSLLNEIRRLDIDREIKAEESNKIHADLLATELELHTVADEYARLEEQVVTDTPAVAARLASLYKLGRPGYWRLILDVDNVKSMGFAYRSVSAMARLDRERIAEHRRKLAALAASRTELEQRKAKTITLQQRASAARAELDRAIAARAARVQEIDRARDLNAQLTGELQDAQRRLQSALADIAAGGAAMVTLPLAPFRGDLPWPVHGRVTSPFGREVSSRFGTSIARNGIEIAAEEGQPVGAVHEGRVAFAGPFTGFGNLVIVEHGSNCFSLYGNLDGLDVRKGETVERQSQLGTVGRTPRGRAALYFELRVDGRPVDPLQWLKR